MAIKHPKLTDLDKVLAMQIALAWAGEKYRLGWWPSDVTERNGGYTQLQDLAPSSATWLALKTVREIAKRVDKETRSRSKHPDDIYTIFRLGFDVDDLLNKRLTHHIHAQAPIHILLKHIKWLHDPIHQPWHQDELQVWIKTLTPQSTSHEHISLGRRIKASRPQNIVGHSIILMRLLLPLTHTYPMPHFIECTS